MTTVPTPLEVEEQTRKLRADLAAETAGVVERRLKSLRNRRLDDAAGIIETAGASPIRGQAWGDFKRSLDDVSTYSAAINTLTEARQAAEREAKFYVKNEPRTYAPGSPHSFYRDLAVVMGAAGDGTIRFDADKRLARYQRELAVESRHSSDEGHYLQRARREVHRGAYDPMDAERRAVDETTAGVMAAPYYLVSQWAAFRSPERAFADACLTATLPNYGLSVNVPSFTSTTTTTAQVDNTGVSETDPSGINLEAPVTQLAGMVTISVQFADRAGTNDLQGDQLIHQQLMQQLDAAVDSYVIAAATANAPTVTDSGTSNVTNFFADVGNARRKLSDTAGTRLQATRAFAPSDVISWLGQQYDGQGRPIVQPDSAALVAVRDDPKWNAFSGIHLPPNLRLDADDNLPEVNGNLEVLVSRPENAVLLMEGTVIPAAFPEPKASTLSVVVTLRKYVAVIVRYAAGTVQISGSTYNGLT